jgi:GntR family transcriptional repressor for pyruvate dehydrogenase complex
MFSKARQVRAFENIIQQVEDAILKGGLSAGDRLPPERELQKMLDVSRNTLRESLRVLEQKGLIEIRAGNKGGIFVRQINSDQMAETLALFVQSNRITLDQMAQFRQDLEGIVAARAARRSKVANLNPIYQLLEEAARLAQTGVEKWDEFMQVDKQIHLALAEAAGNPLHRFFLETVHNNIHFYNIHAYLPRTLEIIDICLKDLEELVEAVSKGKEKLAQAIAQEHVERFNVYMENASRQTATDAGPTVDA